MVGRGCGGGEGLLGRVRIGGRLILVDREVGHSDSAQLTGSDSGGDEVAQPVSPWNDLGTAQDASSQGARARSCSGCARTPSDRSWD